MNFEDDVAALPSFGYPIKVSDKPDPLKVQRDGYPHGREPYLIRHWTRGDREYLLLALYADMERAGFEVRILDRTRTRWDPLDVDPAIMALIELLQGDRPPRQAH